LEEFADLEMIAGHGPDLGHQFLADVFGEGLLVHLGGQMIAALGGGFVEGTLEEFEGLVDLAFELFLAELKEFGLFAHVYAYIYAYFRASKPACPEKNAKLMKKTVRRS
jgi:hypothetical protein